MSAASRSTTRVGERLLRWAQRHCSPGVVDALVLPVVADLQYEDDLHRGRPLARLLVRARGYLGLVVAFGLHYAIGRGSRMEDSPSTRRPTTRDFVRAALLVPVALVAISFLNVLLWNGPADVLYLTGAGRDTIVRVHDATRSWLGSSVVLMAWGASVVVVGFLLVPRIVWPVTSRDRTIIRAAVIGLGALFFVTVGLSVFESLSEGPKGLAPRLAGWLGAGTAFGIGRRARLRSARRRRALKSEV